MEKKDLIKIVELDENIRFGVPNNVPMKTWNDFTYLEETDEDKIDLINEYRPAYIVISRGHYRQAASEMYGDNPPEDVARILAAGGADDEMIVLHRED